MATWCRKFMEMVAHDITARAAGKRCLILAPHPDDEVLGCGGTIARKVRGGADVTIAFLTDGRCGIAGSEEQAAAVRRREALGAADVIGLAHERLVFFGFEDGRLSEHVEAAAQSVRWLVRELQVDELFVPYRRDYHPDHVAAWRIGAACLGRRRRPGMHLYEYPIWYGPWLWPRLTGWARVAAASHLRDAFSAVKVNIADVVDIKRRAMAAHESQVAALGSWDLRWLESFHGTYELFFVGRRLRAPHVLRRAQEEPRPEGYRRADT